MKITSALSSGPLRLIAIGITGASLAIAGTSGVFASLNAEAYSTAQTASSGTLKLVLNPNTNGVGFTQAISLLAPGDAVTRYVDIQNSGTLDAQSLTLGIVDGPAASASLLSTSAIKGLQVTVNSCSVAWTVTLGSPGSATCSTTSHLETSGSLSAYVGAPQAFAHTNGVWSAAGHLYLQVAVALPDQIETTTNGVLPAGTIQGLTANLVYTFAEAQRTALSTNS